jgi:hypothetical protein
MRAKRSLSDPGVEISVCAPAANKIHERQLLDIIDAMREARQENKAVREPIT